MATGENTHVIFDGLVSSKTFLFPADAMVRLSLPPPSPDTYQVILLLQPRSDVMSAQFKDKNRNQGLSTCIRWICVPGVHQC